MLGACRATTSAMTALQSFGCTALPVALLLGDATEPAGDEVPSHERCDHQDRTQYEISIACSSAAKAHRKCQTYDTVGC